jgi:hypothetical protein
VGIAAPWEAQYMWSKEMKYHKVLGLAVLGKKREVRLVETLCSAHRLF